MDSDSIRLLKNTRKSDVQIFNLGNNEWRSIGEAPYRLEKRSSPPGILVSGRLHWMSQRGNYNGRRERIIVSFDLVDDSFQEIPRPDTGTLRSWANDHLAVLGGCLSAAVPSSLGNGALDIWVMKEYGVKDSWVKDFTLGAYSPTLILAELREPYWIWKSFLGRRFVQIICLLKNGDILVEYRGTLASYNPDSGIFKEVSFQGMPRLFQTTVHIGSLNPVQS
ncbi:F-box At3g07870-like isoform X2 [Olea europaea subsp. europaea]|uniref:F-box At3g07870-like isoform X2 n=1 Tax=Olea europaea subsp. europaea TaxID=158383 RepID=A0A8S0RMS4_OLEEU|nr:F-box At3g07870-like isoform X2 [Olea europaea subsp. europaea]